MKERANVPNNDPIITVGAEASAHHTIFTQIQPPLQQNDNKYYF